MQMGMHGERLKGRLASLGCQMGFGSNVNGLGDWIEWFGKLVVNLA